MKLYDIIDDYKIKNSIGNTDIEIENLNNDSRNEVKNSLFFCINGGELDSHFLYKEAIKNGAIAFVVEKILPISLPQILVENSREALAIMSKNFFLKASDKMKIIGVIGTNGKTTTTFMLAEILKSANYNVGIIGTSGIYMADEIFENSLTTPDPIELHRTLKKMYENNVQIVCLEVSAHAIYLNKMYGIKLEYGIFTNITQDHLDFFETMENYALTKINYFNFNNMKSGIINIDDARGRSLALKDGLKCYTYGLNNPSDAFAINYEVDLKGISFTANIFDNIFEINLKLTGKFNIYNALASGVCAYLLGVKPEHIIKGLNNLSRVDGRFNVFESKRGFYVIIDFAHTEDALKNLLQTINECKKRKVILVFGCGGNRDRKKRSKMGLVAEKLADEIVITSDNPRYEDEMKIALDIASGIENKKYITILNRKKAIEYAVNNAKKGDIVVIAGKGQEKYQEIMGVKYEFNDEAVVKNLLLEG